MSTRQYFRRHAYRWHRITSAIVAIPILLWTLSGLLHPIVNSRKPQVRNQALPVAVIDTARISVSLEKALQLNGIKQISNFRVIKLYEVFYYQVQQPGLDTLTYINCASGTTLLNGDNNYASYLAQQFLYAKVSGNTHSSSHHQAAAASLLPYTTDAAPTLPGKARVKSVRLLRHFDKEYKGSNKLLPVYRVAFDRADSIRLYIETRADRLALSVDQRKAWFTRFFAYTHSWHFLDGLGKTKNLLLGGFSLLCVVSGVLGFYVYNITNRKRRPVGNTTKRIHRVLGNLFMTTTLLYALSGGWHSLQKIAPRNGPRQYTVNTVYDAGKINLDPRRLMTRLQKGAQLNDVSLVQMDSILYWQATITQNNQTTKHYYHTQTLELAQDGDTRYGRYLASRFSKQAHQNITYSRAITAFSHDYSMMNKRLPVVEVGFGATHYFIETATGTLAAVTHPASRAERLSFANLHMHHYWEMGFGKAGGRTARNVVLIATTLGLLVVALTGIMLWVRRKRAQ